ncbi:MAG: hypothetical protein HC915_06425 [Anaerolineae bacterium]|nr:hypothetical protein [Anaerolineae bacterium]
MNTEVTVVEGDAHTRFVGRVNVGYNESRRVRFEYTVADAIDRLGSYHRYQLLIEKQPGSQFDGVTVTITLPPGAQVVSATPEPTSEYQLGPSVLEFNLALTRDIWITVIYE